MFITAKTLKFSRTISFHRRILKSKLNENGLIPVLTDFKLTSYDFRCTHALKGIMHKKKSTKSYRSKEPGVNK
jgi:hypothetical protein